MTNKGNMDPKKPRLPQKDAVKFLREKFEQRKSEVESSKEIDEILKKERSEQEEPARKIARPKREPDLDLP